MKTAVLFAVTVFVAGASSTPWGSRATKQCASYCKDANKFQYEPGMTYVYDYSAETSTSVRGTTDDEAKLQISAQVELEVISPCEMVLQLTRVQGSSDEFAGSLERFPLMFSFQDGTVEHLCPIAEEEAWALNIKRGILSALQNTMPDVPAGPLNVHEIDVTGHCEANYTLVSQSRKGLVVRRTKDLMACTGRNTHVSLLQSTPYSSASKVQSLPLLKCDNECLQTIRDKKVEKVTCSETHIFRPFSNQMSGAVTVVVQSLTYAREERRNSQPFDAKISRASLLFDYAAAKITADQEAQVTELLSQLVAESNVQVSSQVPILFSRLVNSLRSFSYSHLSQIYFSIPTDSRARRFIVDATPRVGTAAAMALMRDLVKDNQVSDREANTWYASLAFKTNPTLEMITAVAPVLHESNPSSKAILGISAMINSYCRSTAACDQEMEIQNVIRSVEKRLGSGCRVTSDEHQEQILMALKALGNAGVITASTVLQRCYEENNPMVIRLAAIDAIRRSNCDSDLRIPLMALYQSMNQDTELRIAAYLALMQCPSRPLLDQIKSSLTSESVNQVGSFVWTHLTNLQESANPNKQYVKELLASEFLQNKFNTDVRKFSRNFEASAFWEEINVGGTVESNLIFSSKSYLPRSAMLNLTVDLFGESINFLEIGARVEGFESLVESLFAPGGLYADETLQSVLQSIRGKREVDENALSQLSSTFDAASSDIPEGTMYMRVFGNDLAVKNFKGLDQLMTLPRSNVFEKLMQLAQNQKDMVDYTKSFTFVDASYTIPTIVGLPLTLSINGTATLGFRMGGKFDYRGLTSMDISGHVQPSAAMAVQAVMLVDAFKTQSGVQLTNNLHTSSGLQGKIQIQNAELVAFQLDTPQDKVELFDFTSQLFTIQHGQIKALVNAAPAIVKKSCSSDRVATVLGVQVCVEAEYPVWKSDSPAGLLAGPVHLALNLLKTDSHSGYSFEYRWSNENVRRQTVRTLTVMLDTPKSRVDRRLAARLHIDPVGKTLRASLQSPFKTADVHGKYEYSAFLKNTDLIVNVDGKEYGTLRTALRSDIKETSGRHEPSLVLTRKGKTLFDLQGYYTYSAGSKYGLDLQIKQLTGKPIKISADLNKDGDKQDLTFAIKSYPLDSNVRMNLRLSEKVISSKFNADYSVLEGTTQTVDLSAKLSRAAKGTLKKYTTVLTLQTTQFPALNSEASWEVQSSPSYLENNGRLVVSKKQWDLQQLYSSQSVRGQRDVTFRVGLSCPKNKIDYLFNVVHQETDNTISNAIIVRVAPQREYTSQLELLSKVNPAFYNAQWTLTTPESNGRFRAELLESAPRQWEAVLGSQWKSEPETVFSANYKNVNSGLDVEYSLGIKATSPYFKTSQLSAAFSAGATKTTLEGEALYGDLKYGAYLDYEEMTSTDVHVTGRVEKNAVALYTGSIALKDDTTKSVSVDLKFNRHITLDAKFTPSDQSLNLDIDLFWDKDRDLSQTFRFAGKTYGLSGDAQIKYPGRTINLQASLIDHTIRGEVEWAPDQKIAVDVQVKFTDEGLVTEGRLLTPFRGYEQFTFDTSMKNDREGFDTKVAVASRQQKVSFTINGIQKMDQIRGKFALTTTFANFQDVSFGMDYVNNYVARKVGAYVSHNGQKTEVQARLSTSQGVSGVLSIATPLEGYRSLVTSFGHRIQDGQVKTELEIQANRVSKVNLSYNGQYTGSEKAGTFVVASTYDALRTLSLNYQYSFAANARKLSWEAELNGQKMSLAASTICENGNGELQFSFNSPMTQEISASFKHSFDGQTFATNGQAQWSRDQKLSFNVQAKTGDVNNVLLEGEMMLNTQVGKLSLTHKAPQAGKFNTNLNAAFNEDQISFQVESETQVTSSSRVLRFATALNAPFPALQGLQMTLDYSRRPQSVITKLALNQQSQTVALLTHTLKKQDLANWESQMELSTSASKLRLVNKQATASSSFQHDSEAFYNNQKVSLSLAGRQGATPGQVIVTGSFAAPEMESVMFEFQHDQDETQYHPVLLMRSGNAKPVKLEALTKRTPNSQNFYLALNSPYTNPISFQLAYSPEKVETIFQWDQSSQAILSASRQMREYQGNFQANLKTPFVNFRNLGINIEYDIPQLMGQASFFQDEQKFNLLLNAVNTDGLYEAQAQLTTPIEGFQAVSVQATLNLVDMSGRVVYKRNTIDVTVQANLQLAYNQGKLTLTVSSPFEDWKAVKVEGSYASEPRRQSLQLATNVNGQKTSFTSDLAYLDTTGSMTVTFVSAIRGYETVSLKGQYDFGPSRKSCNAVLTKNSEQMEFSLDSRINPNNGNLQISLQAPYYNIEQVVFSGTFEASQAQKTGQFSVQVNDQIVTLESQSLFTKTNGQFNIKMTTPFLHPTTLTLEGSYDFSKDRNVNLSFTQGTQKIDINAIAKFSNIQKLEVAVNVLTPFTDWNTLQFNGKYDIRKAEKVGEVLVSRNDDKFQFILNGKLAAKEGKMGAKIYTPYADYKTVMTELVYSVETPKKLASLMVDINSTPKTIAMEFEFIDNKINLKVNTPFSGFETVNMDGEYSPLETARPKAIFGFQRNGQRFEFNLMGTVHPQNYVTSIEIRMPIQNWELMTFNFESNCLSAEKTANLRVSKNEFNFGLNFAGQFGTRKSEMKLNGMTSISGWDSFGLTGKYNFQDSLSGSLSWEKNGQKQNFGAEAAWLETEGIRLNINTPYQGYRELGINGRLINFENDKSALLTLQKEGRSTDFSAALNFEQDSALVSLRTPFAGFEEITAKLRYNLQGKKKTFDLGLVRNKDRFDVSAALAFSNVGVTSAQSELHLTLPVYGWENIDFNFKYDLSTRSKTFNADIARNGSRFSASGSVILSKQSAQVAFTVASPISGYEELGLSGEILYGAKKASVVLAHNGRHYDVTAALQMDSNNIDATLTTPFKGYETMAFSGRLVDNQFEITATTPFRQFQTVTALVEYDFFSSPSKFARFTITTPLSRYENEFRFSFTALRGEASLKVQTPVSSWETLGGSFVYDFQSAEKYTNIAVEKTFQRYETGFKLSFDEYSALVGINLKTPFSGYDELDVNVQYSLASRLMSFGVERNGKSLVQLTAQGQISALNSQIEATFLVPLVSSETYSFVAKYNLNSDFSAIEGTFKLSPYVVELKGNHRNYLMGSLTLNIAGQDATIDWDIAPSATKFLISYAGKNLVDYSDESRFVSFSQFNTKATLQTPYFNTQTFAIEFDSTKKGRTTFKLSHDWVKGRFNTELLVKYGASFGNLDAAFKSTFTPDLTFSTSYNYRKDLTAEANIQWAADRLIKLSVHTRPDSEGKLTLTTPFFETFTVESTYDEKTFHTKCTYGSQTVQLEGSYNLPNPLSAEVSVSLLTPFEGFQSTMISALYNFQGSPELNVVVNTDPMRTEFRFNADFGDSEGSFKTNFFCTGHNGVDLNLNGNYKTLDGLSGDLGFSWTNDKALRFGVSLEDTVTKVYFTSSFAGLENLELICNTLFNDYDDKVQVTMNFGEKSVQATAYWNFGEGKQFSLNLKTPFQGFEDLTLRGSVNSAQNHNASLSYYNQAGRLVELNADITTSNGGSQAHISFLSPYQSMQDLSMTIEYDISSNQPTVSVFLRKDNHEINLAASGSFKDNVSAQVTFKSSFSQTLTFNLDMDTGSTEKTARLNLEYGEQKFELNASGFFNGSSGKLRTTLSTPFAGFKKMAFNGKINRSNVDFGFEYARNKKIQIQGNYVYEPQNNNYGLESTLSTPFFEPVNFKANTQYDDTSAKAYVQWSADKYLSVSGLLNENEFSVALESPYPYLRAVKFTGVLADTSAETSVSTSVTYNDYQGSIQGRYLTGNNRFGVSVQAEYNSNIIAADFYFQNEQDKLESYFKLTTPFAVMSNLGVNLDYTNQSNQLYAKLQIQTPFEQLPTLTIAAQGSNDADTLFEGFFELTTFQTLASVKVSLNQPSGSTYSGNLNYNIPAFTAIPTASLTAFFEIPSVRTVKAELGLTLPSGYYQLQSSYVLKKNSFRTSLDVSSPEFFRPVNVGFSYSANHDLSQVESEAFLWDNRVTLRFNNAQQSLQFEATADFPYFQVQGYTLNTQVYYRFPESMDATLKFACPQGEHKVVLSYTLANQQLQAKAELYTNLFATKHSVNLKVGFTPVAFELRYTGEGEHSLTFSVQDGERFTVEGKLSCPWMSKQDHSASVSMVTGELDGYIDLQWSNKTHRIVYNIAKTSGFELSLDAFSPYLQQGTFAIKLSYTPSGNDQVQGKLSFQYGGATHVLTSQVSTEVDQLAFQIKLETPLLKEPISFEIQSSKGAQFAAHVKLTVFGHIHQLNANAKLTGPFQGEAKVESPLIPSKVISFTIQTRLQSLKDMQVELNFNCGEKNTRFFVNGRYNGWKDMEGFVTLNTPCQTWSMLRLNGHFKVNAGLNAGVEFQTSNPAFASSSLSVKYELTDSLDVSITAKTPFRYYDNLSLLLNVPLSGRVVEPRLTVSLPSSQHSFSAKYTQSDDRFEINAQADCFGRKLGSNLIVKLSDVFEAHLEVNTPVKGYERYVWDVKGQANIKNWGQSNIFLDWNGQKIEFVSNIRVEPRAYIATFELNTPFSSYEKFALNLRLQGSDRKTVHAEIEYPGARVGVEFDYVFNSKSNFVAKAAVHTPFQNYESFTIELTNQLEPGSKYLGNVQARFANYGIAVSSNAVWRENTAEASFEAKLNQHVASMKANAELTNQRILAEVSINTPFEILRNLDGFLRFERRDEHFENGLGLTVNNRKIILVTVTKQESVITIEVFNPVQPVSLSFAVEHTPEQANLQGYFCWDLNRKADSTLGTQFSLKKTTFGQQISCIATAAERTIVLDYVFESSSTKLDHAIQVTWAEGKSAGYKIALEDASSRRRTQLDAVFRFDLPVRSFQIESHHIISNGESSTCVELKWDAARDRTKRVGARFETNDLSSWNIQSRKANLVLVHSALLQDVVLSGQYAKGTGNDLFNGKVELTYSPLESHRFVVLTNIKDLSSTSRQQYDVDWALQHPASNTDLRLTTGLNAKSDETAGNLRVDYQDRYGNSRFLQLQSKITQLKNQIEMELRTTENTLAWTGSMLQEGGSYSVFSRTAVNDLEPFQIKGELNVDQPAGQIDLDYATGKKWSVYAGLPTDKEILVKSDRDIYGKTVTDAFFSLKLNTTKLLSKRMHWRTESAPEIKAIFLNHVTDLLAAVQNMIGADLLNGLAQELTSRQVAIAPIFTETQMRVAEFMAKEWTSLRGDFADLEIYAHNVYANNEFYVRSLAEVGRQMYDSVSPKVAAAFRQFLPFSRFVSQTFHTSLRMVKTNYQTVAKVATQTYAQIQATVSSVATQIGQAYQAYATHFNERYGDILGLFGDYYGSLTTAFDLYYGRMEETIMNTVEDLRSKALSFINSYTANAQIYAKKVQQWVQYVQEKYVNAQQMMQEMSLRLRQYLLTFEPVRGMVQVYQQYASWLEEFHFQEYVEQVKVWANEVASTNVAKLQAMTAQYKPYFEAAVNAIEGQYQELQQLPIVAFVSNVVSRVNVQVSELTKYYQLEIQVRQVLREALQYIDLVCNQMAQELQGSFDLDLKRIFLYEPQNGRIEYTQYLPVEWENFKSLPQFGNLPFIQKSVAAKQKFLDNFDITPHYYKFMDAMATYKPDVKLSNILPPFGSHAFIAGTQHYMTFDQKYYEFAGECSYLLVSDFVSNNFSVVVNYEGQNGQVTKKSLTVLLEGRQMDIDSTYRVSLNGKKVELPFRFGQTSVIRHGHHIVLNNRAGYQIDCNLYRDICTVQVSGWTFGKTGGLFGVYNNEPSDDFLTPTRQLRTDTEVDSFANSWKVGTSRCRVKNYAVDAQFPSQKNDRTCQELFTDDSSVLRPCFNIIDSTPYVRMCTNDLTMLENSPKKELGVCTAASAYVSECRLAGVDVWMPPKCVRCELEDGKVMQAGELKTFNNDAPRSADVVFLVDQKTCLKNVRLSNLPSDLDAALKERGINNNRFAVVGFGGKGIFQDPHIRTTENQIFNNKQMIAKAFESIQFNGVEKSDVFAALRYAAKLPFRAGVSKQIVLLTCDSDCDAENYADALTLLLENDINLHLLQPRQLQFRTKTNEESKYVFGFDAENVYSARDVRKMIGDKDLRRQLVIPKDFCTPLALETNGTLFDLSQMLTDKPLQTKKFVDVFVRRVALTSDPSDCQRCDCLADKDGVGYLQCQRCISPSIEKFIKDWEKLAYESENLFGANEVQVNEIRSEAPAPVVAPTKATKKSNKRN